VNSTITHSPGDGSENSRKARPRTNCTWRKAVAYDYKSNGQMVSNHVPSAAQYPRHGAGRKSAYGVAMRWRKRHPCPRHHDEHRSQDQGTGQEQGRTRQTNEQEVRALHVPYMADNHGLSRLLTVSRKRCSTAVCCACHVVPKLSIKRTCLRRASAPGWVQDRARGWWVTRARVSRRVDAGGVAGLG
jgi:hypothetical protein